jgi:hypothetical protein
MTFWGTIIVSRKFEFKQKGRQTAEGCHTLLDGQHCPLITYQGIFFKSGETI